MIRKERRKRTSSRTRLRMGNPESAAPRETHAAESLQKLFGGAEGQNSDFRVWRCEEEGVGTGGGSWPGRGRGRGRVREAGEDTGFVPPSPRVGTDTAEFLGLSQNPTSVSTPGI